MTSSTRFRRTAIFVVIPLVLGFVVWRVLRPMALQHQLQSAVARNDLTAARLLVSQGANPTPRNGGISDLTLVLMSVKRDDNASLVFFLKHGASTDGPQDRESPLMLAVRRTNVEAVKILLAHGADIRAEESHGWTLANFYTAFLNQPRDADERKKQ